MPDRNGYALSVSTAPAGAMKFDVHIKPTLSILEEVERSQKEKRYIIPLSLAAKKYVTFCQKQNKSTQVASDQLSLFD